MRIFRHAFHFCVVHIMLIALLYYWQKLVNLISEKGQFLVRLFVPGYAPMVEFIRQGGPVKEEIEAKLNDPEFKSFTVVSGNNDKHFSEEMTARFQEIARAGKGIVLKVPDVNGHLFPLYAPESVLAVGAFIDNEAILSGPLLAAYHPTGGGVKGERGSYILDQADWVWPPSGELRVVGAIFGDPAQARETYGGIDLEDVRVSSQKSGAGVVPAFTDAAALDSLLSASGLSVNILSSHQFRAQDVPGII